MPHVRPAASADRGAVLAIQRAAIAEPWPALLETALEGPPPLYVVEDGEPVGYAAAIADGDSVAYLPEVAIHPDRQGEGLGSLLLDAIVEEFGDHEELRVTVRVVDDRARAFYGRHGFEPVEHVADHFEAGDGIILRRPLDGAGNDG